MWKPNCENDSICALATPPGHGGIAVVRLSGSNALAIAKKCCPFLPDQPESHRIYFGTFTNFENSEKIDQLLVSYFAEGKSYTGEQSIEFSCHGSPLIVRNIIESLVKCGAKIAEKGEFTFRSFMNGKIDLTQAEGVLSLIESQTKRASRLALRQLLGGLKDKFDHIEETIITVLAQIEAGIDFSDQDIEVLDYSRLMNDLSSCRDQCSLLLDSYEQGRIIAEGLQVAIVGRPNVGKSSLLNALLREDKAIVTPIAGTTRDLVEGNLQIQGVLVKFIDTAGLRLSDNTVEQIGIKKAFEAAENADLILYVVDAQDKSDSEVFDHLQKLKNKEIIIVINKLDLIDGEKSQIEKNVSLIGVKYVFVSALMARGIDTIEKLISDHLQSLIDEDSTAIIQNRHYFELSTVKTSLMKSIDAIEKRTSGEIIASELFNALLAIKRITGKEYDDDILNKIFSEFCLGK